MAWTKVEEGVYRYDGKIPKAAPPVDLSKLTATNDDEADEE